MIRRLSRGISAPISIISSMISLHSSGLSRTSVIALREWHGRQYDWTVALPTLDANDLRGFVSPRGSAIVLATVRRARTRAWPTLIEKADARTVLDRILMRPRDPPQTIVIWKA